MDYFRKNQKQGRPGHGISRGIQERTCGNSRGQSKKKWNFQECTRKNHIVSRGLGFWTWNFRGVSHNFAEFPGVKACFLWNFLDKVTNLKNPEWVWEKCIFNPPVCIFPATAQCCQFCLQFWPLMICRMMHQICHCFYWSIKNWSKLGQKIFFWLVLWIFCLRPLTPYELHSKNLSRFSLKIERR